KPDDPVSRLRERADNMATTAAAMKKIAEAADPLYKTLDDGQKRRLAVLAITTSLLNGCGTVRSEHGRLATCPPVVEYGREFQARAADELNLLPEGSAIVEMLADYSVMRDQARACR
ncbi:MAG: hypothetical protein K2Y42_19240, partial [Hyphomicrobium sp.]|nr:hypothetical protein [Hyphomicrobium sp.]